jgi:hypothetical protein
VNASAPRILINVGGDTRFGKCVFGNLEGYIADCMWSVKDGGGNAHTVYVKGKNNGDVSNFTMFSRLFKSLENGKYWGCTLTMNPNGQTDIVELTYNRQDGGMGRISLIVVFPR